MDGSQKWRESITMNTATNACLLDGGPVGNITDCALLSCARTPFSPFTLMHWWITKAAVLCQQLVSALSPWFHLVMTMSLFLSVFSRGVGFRFRFYCLRGQHTQVRTAHKRGVQRRWATLSAAAPAGRKVQPALPSALRFSHEARHGNRCTDCRVRHPTKNAR